MFTRRLTVRDRKPRIGDVLRYGRTRITIKDAYTGSMEGCFLVQGGRGLYRIGLHFLQGEPQEGRFWYSWRQGHLYYTVTGYSFSPVSSPYHYESRADGGRVDWPIDAGAYC